MQSAFLTAFEELEQANSNTQEPEPQEQVESGIGRTAAGIAGGLAGLAVGGAASGAGQGALVGVGDKIARGKKGKFWRNVGRGAGAGALSGGLAATPYATYKTVKDAAGNVKKVKVKKSK